LSFVSLSWSKITNELAINLQNSARVRPQLKFAFITLPLGCFLHELVKEVAKVTESY